MQLPFTIEQFYTVFSDYNTAVWPAQVVLFGLAILAIMLVVFPRQGSGLGISLILVLLWAWLGIAYHLVFFSRINPLAYGFAVVSILGAIIFLWQGVIRRRLTFRMALRLRTILGAILLIFALVVYPLWSVFTGHSYPELPTFGLPCPTTIFTIGLLAFLEQPHPRSIWLVPVVWAFVGGQAAFLLGVPQDLGLLVAGVVGLGCMFRNQS